MTDPRFMEFGLPPVGEHAELCATGAVPADVLKIVTTRYEERHPGVFVLAALVDDVFCVYHRTRCAAWRKQSIKRVILEPVGPAKGPGYILMSIETIEERFATPILSSGFNDRIGAWIEDRAEEVSSMLAVPYEQLPLGADA